jgi:hypothetical protein
MAHTIYGHFREKGSAVMTLPIYVVRLMGLVGGFNYFLLNFLLKPAKVSLSLLTSYSFA